LAGLTQFYTTDSPKKILAWLKNNGGLGILIDTDSDKVRNVSVPLFGHSNNTPVGQSVFGLRTGTALLPMCCVRISHERYRVIIKPAVPLPEGDNFDENVYTVTAACMQELQEMIDTYKDQWIWLHNRWPDINPETNNQ
jgi:KDO2-lipid IV(A) lauroyltransferase